MIFQSTSSLGIFLTSGLTLWRHQPYPRDPWLICISINTTSGLGSFPVFFTSGLLLWRHQPYPRDPWLICVSINTTSGLGHVVWILAPDWLGPIPPCSTTCKIHPLGEISLQKKFTLCLKARRAKRTSHAIYHTLQSQNGCKRKT